MSRIVAGAPIAALAGLDAGKLRAERDRIVARIEGHAPPITRVLSVPRAVMLGGSRFVARELTLGDLARLQAWLAEQTPHPLANIPPAWADPEPETRPARLAIAWEAARSWPVRYGSTAGSILLASPEGLAYYLTLVVVAGGGLDAAIALDLAGRITPLEWLDLRRIAYGLTPQEEIADELAPDRSAARIGNWCLSFHRATSCDGGPTYLDLDRWTLSAWRNFCTEGKAADLTVEFGRRAKAVESLLKEGSAVTDGT